VAEKLGFDFQNLKIYFHFIGYWVMHGPFMMDVWSKYVEELLKEVIASSTYIYMGT
jgi:L-ribulose-5-phosphate 3-epimerase UlaE